MNGLALPLKSRVTGLIETEILEIANPPETNVSIQDIRRRIVEHNQEFSEQNADKVEVEWIRLC